PAKTGTRLFRPHPRSSRGTPSRTVTARIYPHFHYFWAASRPLVNRGRTKARSRRRGGRPRTQLKPLQIKDFSLKSTRCAASVPRGDGRLPRSSFSRNKQSLANKQRTTMFRCALKSGTRVEREPDAESLLPSGAFGSPQLLRNLRCPGFLAGHRFQLTEFA